jgi:plastocyanin
MAGEWGDTILSGERGVELKRFMLVLIVVGLAYGSVAFAATTQIRVDDDFFFPNAPPVRNVVAGTSFQWQSAPTATRRHNVRQDFKLFYSGPATTAPINFSISASAGTYHYYCEIHGTTSSGMAGVVKVRPTFNANPTGNPFTVIWALTGTNTGNQFDVRYRVDGGTWKTWKNDVTSRSAVFGLNGAPVVVSPGHTYQFQVRSQKVPTQPSGFSPTLTVTT